jgi:hypothetical protein
MSPTHTADEFITNIKGCYTISEALDLEDILNSMPTGNKRIHWVNCKTGVSVSIGRAGGSGPYRKKGEKKPKHFNPFMQVSQKENFKYLSRIHSKII